MVQEPLILAQSGTSLRNIIDLALAPLPLLVEPVVETNSSELMKQLVKAGTGLTMLNPLDAVAECRRGELIFRPLTEAHIRHQPMKLFARARAPLDSATSLFVEYLMQELLALVDDLKARGHIPEAIRGQA